jgi:hypothetical protein
VTDRQEGEVAQPKAVRLKDKIPALKQQCSSCLLCERCLCPAAAM